MADNTNRKQMQTNLSSNSNTIYLHGDHFDKTKAITCSLFAPPSPPHPPPGSLWVTQTDDITNSRYIQPVRAQQSWWCFTLLPLSLSLVSHSDAPLLCRLSLSLTHTLTHTHRLSLSPSFLRTAADMVDAFVGTWLLKESDKFDDYMKELGKCSVYFYFFLLLFFFLMHAHCAGECARMRVKQRMQQ